MRILSLGAGVQSSTLALMIEHGEVERVDCAIFADTGWEPKSVYTWLDWLESQLSYPVYRVSNGSLREFVLTGTPEACYTIPFFSEDGGMGRRQCTANFKIRPIKKKVRELLGLEKGERANGKQATMLIGISTDEIQRMKPAPDNYLVNEWPLIDARMSRSDCLQWMARNGYPLPEKSSCIGCPYHSDAHWRDMRQNDPEAWADACEVDELIRDMGKMKQRQYMHRSLVPLRMATLGDEYTVDMFGNECEGMCGV